MCGAAVGILVLDAKVREFQVAAFEGQIEVGRKCLSGRWRVDGGGTLLMNVRVVVAFEFVIEDDPRDVPAFVLDAIPFGAEETKKLRVVGELAGLDEARIELLAA